MPVRNLSGLLIPVGSESKSASLSSALLPLLDLNGYRLKSETSVAIKLSLLTSKSGKSNLINLEGKCHATT